jgi:hypothetical protein
MTTKEEIKQRLKDLALELNAVCYDAELIPKLRSVWDKLVLLNEYVEDFDDGWRDATKELPELIQGKDYSEHVFAKVKGREDIEVMCVGLIQDDNGICHRKWANCYGDIYGDGYYDDEYEVTEWKYINF